MKWNIFFFTEIQTQPSAPTFLLKTGFVRLITNQSVCLNILPPLRLNGDISSIVLKFETIIKDQKTTTQIELLDEKILKSKIDSNKLLSMLNNITVANLKPNQTYLIKSRFCSTAGCIWSTEGIEFRTFFYYYLTKLRWRIEGRSAILDWELNLKKDNSNIVYQVKDVSGRGLFDTIIYEGKDKRFEIKDFIPLRNYSFEILAISEENVNLIDRKSISFQPISDS